LPKKLRRFVEWARVRYLPRADAMAFTLVDRQQRDHPYACSFALFEDFLQELNTRFAHAESERDPALPRQTRNADEELKFEVGTSDGRLVRLRVFSSRDKAFEVRFEADAATALAEQLLRARDAIGSG